MKSAPARVQVLDVALRVSTAQTSSLVNCEGAGKVWYLVASTLNTPLGLQKVGTDQRGGTSINVGEIVYIEESSTIMLEVPEAERVPWMGCQVQSDDVNIPTSGRVTITMIVEEK